MDNDNCNRVEDLEWMNECISPSFCCLSPDMVHSTTISSQTRAEVEELVKRGIEALVPGLIEETLRRELHLLQASIPALVDGVIKKHLLAIPGLVEEAFKSQLKAIPDLVLSVIKGQITTSSVLPSLHNFAPPLASRSSPQQTESSNSRILHLKFEGKLPKELFTKDNIKDQGASLNVELHDQSGNIVDVGPESSAKIKIIVVNGDFKVEDDFSDEDIRKHVVPPREGKAPLLKGKYELLLCNGVASVGEIAFTDNSKSMRNGKFRLGAQVLKGLSSGVAIKGAVSDDFQVKEHRNTFNRKRDTLSLDDKVWHLVNIGKGKIHEKLEKKGVHCVKDLLRLYNDEPEELLQIFRGNKKKLQDTINMAKSCSQPGLILDNYQVSHKELYLENSLGTAFEKQMEILESYSSGWFMQPEELYSPSTSVNMHLNAIGADQVTGVMPYQEGEGALPGYYTPSPEFTGFILSETGCPSPRWRKIRDVLRFNIAIKIKVKEGPRAGKRQKLG